MTLWAINDRGSAVVTVVQVFATLILQALNLSSYFAIGRNSNRDVQVETECVCVCGRMYMLCVLVSFM